MKFRIGFVSNSSSSSFVLKRRLLTEFQEKCVMRHIECAEQLLRWDKEQHWNSPWRVHMEDKVITGDTSMDNFPMEEFFEAIGIPSREYEIEKDG